MKIYSMEEIVDVWIAFTQWRWLAGGIEQEWVIHLPKVIVCLVVYVSPLAGLCQIGHVSQV